MLAKRTYKNQITIPKKIIEDLQDVEYFDVSRNGNDIILRPVFISGQGSIITKAREKIKGLGLDEKDIEDAIRWVRTK